ncbi:MAG: hypothetical protein M1831_006361 [Alyxoria varia]|nr:MAG: hypothetical protein M1831_006361 [Alyxoria varia]
MSSLHPSTVDSSTYAPSDDAIHNGVAWASAPTIDPWDPMILTLDGGGIRGYSSLLILQALMHRIHVWEERLQSEHESSSDPVPDERDLLPCHYFDFMYGTSTGGLIGTMLGRLRMTVTQCLEVYRDVGESLFGKQRSIIPLTTKYRAKPLVHAVQEIVRSHCKQHIDNEQCHGNDWHPWSAAIPHNRAGADFDSHLCQSICLTAAHNGRIDEAHLLRTYDHHYVNVPNWIHMYNEGADKLRIWQVTRATSAAPFYFQPLEAVINEEAWTFKDGGIRENNPAGAAWSEFISLYGEYKDPALLLSVGTGRPDETQDGFATAWPGPFGNNSWMRKAAEKFAVLKNVMIKYTDGEDKHKEMKYTARGEHTWYKRLNVSSGLEDLPLDSWKKGMWRDPATGEEREVSGGQTLARMERATGEYLRREKDDRYDSYTSPKVMLDQAAEKLVRQRLARKEASRKGDDELEKRYDTYMGRYIHGDDATHPDGPIVNG